MKVHRRRPGQRKRDRNAYRVFGKEPLIIYHRHGMHGIGRDGMGWDEMGSEDCNASLSVETSQGCLHGDGVLCLHIEYSSMPGYIVSGVICTYLGTYQQPTYICD